MKICLNCGKESEKWLCEKCMLKLDIKKVCDDINNYDIQSEKNPIFNNVIKEIGFYNFKSISREIAELITDDFEKSSIILSSITNHFTYRKIYSSNKKLLYKYAPVYLKDNFIPENNKQAILDALFISTFDDFDYKEAEKYANKIKESEITDKFIIYQLGKYYLYTRRYPLAEKFLKKRIDLLDGTEPANLKDVIEKTYNEVDKRKKGEMREYMPLKPEMQEKYCDFMDSIGLQINRTTERAPRKRSRMPSKISVDAYPNIKENEINEFNFDTFVAFDLETTGFKRKLSKLAKAGKIDDIIEIAAIKVVNGKIDESSQFTFQELVHPLKQTISKEIEELTGITNEMVYDADQIWDVFPKFMEFVGDNILVGFNCINFDCDFLIRAGRYSNIIIKNNFFDIYRNLESLNLSKSTLTDLSNQFNIKNENAHRALSDAITTAKLYLKLKEKYDNLMIKPNNVLKEKVDVIKIVSGTYQESDSNTEIWNTLLNDCDEKAKLIVQNIIKKYPSNAEKPVYYPTVEFVKSKKRILANEVWNKSKVMMFLSENEEDYKIAKKSGWKCFILNEEFDIEDFLRSVV